jgi:hypothetical protein
MCGWIPNGILAAGPSRVNIRRKATADIGAPGLAHEDVSSGLLFALETAQGAKFGAGQWVDGGHPVLNPMDVQPAMAEINLFPAQRARFGCS